MYRPPASALVCLAEYDICECSRYLAPHAEQLADGSDGWLSQILVRESHKGVLVSSVLPSSVASGILCERDTIISVNGVPTRTAKTTAGMLRAAGGTVTLRVVRHDPEELPPVQGESSFLSTVMTSVRRVPPALLSACVAGCILVAVVGWGYSSHASRAALRSAQSEAAKWRGKAMAERESLDAGRRHAAQLAQQEAELRTRIHALRRANQSLSGVAAETLAQLQQQRHNVSEQSRQWRASNRQAQQRLKQARAQVGDLQKQMETVRHDLGSALRTAKAEVTRLEAELNAARAAEHAERAKLARIRKRLRAHAAEMDSLAGGGVSASSEGFSAADAAAAGTSMAPVVPEAPRPDELIGDEHLVVSLNGVNMMFNSNPQARPRYFTLVTVPKADVMAWIASMAVFEGAKVAAGPSGNNTRCITRCFSEQWVTADGMHLLFARVGRASSVPPAPWALSSLSLLAHRSPPSHFSLALSLLIRPALLTLCRFLGPVPHDSLDHVPAVVSQEASPEQQLGVQAEWHVAIVMAQ